MGSSDEPGGRNEAEEIRKGVPTTVRCGCGPVCLHRNSMVAVLSASDSAGPRLVYGVPEPPEQQARRPRIINVAATRAALPYRGDKMRSYEMKITVEFTDDTKFKSKVIQEAIRKETGLPSLSWDDSEGIPGVSVPSTTAIEQLGLVQGEDEEEFADRVTIAAWKANGSWLPITVKATYLEELPYETYSRGEDEYPKMMEGV